YSHFSLLRYSPLSCTRLLIHLLSFPTRRSSDLRPLGALSPHGQGESVGPQFHPGAGMVLPFLLPVPQIHGRSHSGPDRHLGDPRSEEHTSELQSPDHLVCRLLLEKKKKKYNKLS